MDRCLCDVALVSMDNNYGTMDNGDSLVIGDTGESITFVNSTEGLFDLVAIKIPI